MGDKVRMEPVRRQRNLGRHPILTVSHGHFRHLFCSRRAFARLVFMFAGGDSVVI